MNVILCLRQKNENIVEVPDDDGAANPPIVGELWQIHNAMMIEEMMVRNENWSNG